VARRLLLALIAALAAPSAGAEGWEVALTAGRVIPFYDQTFEYDPGALASPIPGATIEQRGVFRLDATGGLALNLSIARDLGRHVAVEARVDTADVSVTTMGARYRLRVNLPAPLPPLSTDLDLGTGTVDLERLRPVSLGLRLQGGRRPRVAVSGGVSWLPAVRFTAAQSIGLGLPNLRGGTIGLDVARVGLTAEAQPAEEGQGRWGVNGGLAVSLPVGGRVSLVLDGRIFRFQKQTLTWGRAEGQGALSAVQEALAREIESRLEPIVFNPAFFHASLGFAVAF
jgi:hypothetical protein